MELKLKNKNEDITYFKRNEKILDFEEIQIIGMNEIDSIIEQKAIKTRIRRDNDSKYIIGKSREIKKWFVSRKF